MIVTSVQIKTAKTQKHLYCLVFTYRVFVTKFNYEHSFTLLLIFCLVLKFESLDTAEVFSLSFSALELVISFIELTGGMNMDANIVVGIGCYGGRPGNRVIAIKRKPYQIKI